MVGIAITAVPIALGGARVMIRAEVANLATKHAVISATLAGVEGTVARLETEGAGVPAALATIIADVRHISAAMERLENKEAKT